MKPTTLKPSVLDLRLTNSRAFVYQMTLEELHAEYIWCEQISQTALDDFDQIRVDRRRRAVERQIKLLELLDDATQEPEDGH